MAICSIALLILGETCHLKGRDMVTVWRTVLLLSGYYCDSTHQHYNVTQFEYVLWRNPMHEWVMNIHYKTWIAQGRFTNMILTPSKQWGVCDKACIQTLIARFMGTTWGPSGADRTQVCPILAAWTLLSGNAFFISVLQLSRDCQLNKIESEHKMVNIVKNCWQYMAHILPISSTNCVILICHAMFLSEDHFHFDSY